MVRPPAKAGELLPLDDPSNVNRTLTPSLLANLCAVTILRSDDRPGAVAPAPRDQHGPSNNQDLGQGEAARSGNLPR